MGGDIKNTFSKKQRLKSRKKLQQIFSAGKVFACGDVKLLAIVYPASAASVQCGVGCNSKIFKKAVDRNRIKRLLREAYRIQQHQLNNVAAGQNKEISVFIIYRGRELPAYATLYEQVGVALQRLVESIDEGNS